LEEELEEFNLFEKNLLNGFITGLFYKSTRGLVPMLIGGVSGMLVVTALNFLTEYLRENDIIAFEMKF